jgi:hypothetical protein
MELFWRKEFLEGNFKKGASPVEHKNPSSLLVFFHSVEFDGPNPDTLVDKRGIRGKSVAKCFQRQLLIFHAKER